jgi:hypothetical protein
MEFVEYNPEVAYNQSKALIKGVVRGIKDLGQLIAHPLDNVVYPVSELIYDATILTLHHQHFKNKHSSLYKTMLEKNPQLHQDCSKRMQGRVSNAKESIKGFANSPLDKQIESLSALGTSILVPIGLVKGIKYRRNVSKFGTGNPPLFNPTGSANLDYNIKIYSLKDVRNLKSINDMIYVYTADNELLISQTYQKTFNKKLFDPMMADKSGGFTMQVLHPELARLKPVYAAGELVINEGKIIEITNFSGHYQPVGTHLGKTVQNAFKKAGYEEVNPSVYVDIFEYGSNPNVTRSRLGGRGTGLSAGTLAQNKEVDAMAEELPKKGEKAKQAYYDLVKCSQRYTIDSPELNIRDQLVKIAQPIQEFGEIGSNLAQLALMTGGHKRTWEGVAQVAQGSVGVAMSLTSLASCGTMLSLGAVTAGIGLALGVMGMIGGFMGSDDDDNGLGEALQQIQQSILAMHNTMITCFQRVEEVLIVCLVGRLNQIGSNLSRLERITTQSFKELHTKDLIDVTDALKKEIVGEHTLTDAEKRHYLRQLSCWIDNHSKSCIQTQTTRRQGDVSKVIEILNETNLDESLPLFLYELSAIVPEIKLEKIESIPNLNVLTIACEVYMIASRRPGYFNNVETIKRAQSAFSAVDKVKKTLKDFKLCGESLVDILTRQYDTYRYWVGQLICNARESSDWTSVNQSLGSYLKEGHHKASLMSTLDDMELRRICLLKISELLDTKVQSFESKAEILNRSAKYYTNSGVYGEYDTKVLKRCFEMGSCPNDTDVWGTPLHYLTKQNYSAPNMHLLFRMHPSIKIDMTSGTKYDQGDTWGHGSSPILHAMNLGRYCAGVLFCANGLDISEANWRCGRSILFNNTHMGNAYWRRDQGNNDSIVNTRLVKLMNTSGDNKLHRSQLRLAYAYYKQIEAGILCKDTNFSLESLLLLTCVIGDLFPLKYYLHVTKTYLSSRLLNTLIQGVDITYLQFAKCCKQHSVTSYLELYGAKDTVPGQLDVSSLYDKKVTLPLLWEINTCSSKLITVPSTTRKSDIQPKIDAYLKLSTAIMQDTVSDDCLLFRDLLKEVIKDAVGSKFYASIMKNFQALNKAIDDKDTKAICSAFNSLNSILSVAKDLSRPYMLSSGISNLISDMKDS